MEKQSYSCKVLVLGEPGAGKSSYVKRYVHNVFSNVRKPTIKVDFAEADFVWDDKIDVHLKFWDLAGQERLGTQSNVFFRGAHAIIIVYDVTDEESTKAIPLWKELVDTHLGKDGNKAEIPSILLANKIDLVVDNSENFDTTLLDAIVKEFGFDYGMPISNCGNYNVAQSVRKLVELLILHKDKMDKSEPYTDAEEYNGALRIVDSPELKSGSKCGSC
jgi:Ras-related protein Rab-32